MLEKLAELWPEIIMALGAVACLLMGVSRKSAIRKLIVPVAGGTILLAGLAVIMSSDETFIGKEKAQSVSTLALFVKLTVVSIGFLLLLIAAGLPDKLSATRESESEPSNFNPGIALRGEFFAFFLFSLTGLMLCASATDLIWLFLALELTSLPTYVMVAISRDRLKAQEAGVKYFFLGAFAVAIFLYGFALIYGATGFTDFESIRAFAMQSMENGDTLSPLFLTGIVLAIIGLAFKIAAFPMHAYAADVYEGAAAPVTAFLAFVPKTAGFVSLILVLGLMSDKTGAMPSEVTTLLAVMAVITMTFGNVMGLLQRNIKRMLAYSSIAHSGYMIVGLLAGASLIGAAGTETANAGGHAGVLFYLVAYGLGNLAVFGVLAMLERKGEEATTIDDISGLSQKHPKMAAVLLISMLSLIGLPPMVGFVGKIYLFKPAVDDYLWLVVVAVINSAISAVYYLRVVSACFFGEPAQDVELIRDKPRKWAAGIAAVASIGVGLTAGWLVEAAGKAVTPPTTSTSDSASAPEQQPAPTQPQAAVRANNSDAQFIAKNQAK